MEAEVNLRCCILGVILLSETERRHSETWGSMIRLGLLANKPQGYFCLPPLRLQSVTVPDFLYGCWGQDSGPQVCMISTLLS